MSLMSARRYFFAVVVAFPLIIWSKLLIYSFQIQLGSLVAKQTLSKSVLSDAVKSEVRHVTMKSEVRQAGKNSTEKPPNLHYHNNTSPSHARADSCTGCMQRPYKFLINSSSICSDVSLENNKILELLILITSTHNHRNKRDAIRNSWAKVAKFNKHPKVRYAFLLGFTSEGKTLSLREENQKHGDIIVQDFKDSYRNLTLKTLMALQWSKEYCPHYRFLMKTDDDMYVHVKNIIHLINSQNLTGTVSGTCTQKSGVIRNPRSKYYASLRQYPHNEYPGFCSGTGYIMPKKVAFDILSVTSNVPFFHLEDVYVSLCVRKLGYKLRRLKGFTAGKYKFTNGNCGFYGSENMHTSHNIGPKELVEIWKKCGQDLK